jgi:drug/metabolite transporter (DMT)-like permease
MIVVTPFAWRRAGPGFWRTRRLGLQLLRSAMLLCATFCFFGGLRYLPLAEGSAITFLAPVFVVVLSGPILGEWPGRARWIAALARVAGLMMQLRPGSAGLQPAARLLLLAALCNALYFLLTRKLVDESVHTTLFYSALVGTLGLTLAVPWEIGAGAPPLKDTVLFVLLGVFAGIGHWSIISAFQHAPAALLTPFAYLQMIWATTYGFVLFGQLPDRWSALGMTIIVASGLLLALRERARLTRIRTRERSAPACN